MKWLLFNNVLPVTTTCHTMDTWRCPIYLFILLELYLQILTYDADAAKPAKLTVSQLKTVNARLRGKRTAKTTDFKSWSAKSCTKLNAVLHQNKVAIHKIDLGIKSIWANKKYTEAEKTFHVQTLTAFKKELNETENMVLNSLQWLGEVLKGNYQDALNMRESSRKRLEALRDATLKEEQEYKAMEDAEKHLESLDRHKIRGVLDEILKDVALAADKLENTLSDHVFDIAINNPFLAQGGNIEAVIRINGDNSNTNNSKSADEGVINLVDANNNQFVLSRGQDTTVPHEDPHFIKDIIVVVLLAFVCGWLCSLLKLPSMFGYIMAGVILGPSGFNVLKSLVQFETLGEFGVFFTLLSVGLEFSPAKLKKVMKIACVGTTMMMLLMIGCGLGLGAAVGADLSESAFVAACLSLSSTPLVVRFLGTGSDRIQDSAGAVDYTVVLMGILIMQDVLLGVQMALLPNMAGNNMNLSQGALVSRYINTAAKLAGALAVTMISSVVLAKFAVGPLMKYHLKSGNKELVLLASASVTFIMLLFTDKLQVSMELGCFLAGAMLSYQGPELAEYLENLLQPLRDFLALIFFASVGLHVFPQFLAYEQTILTSLTITVVFAKFAIGVLVLWLLLPKQSRHVKWIVSAGLAQVSEFSFVLGSRARRLGIISREVYLLILSITTLSLLFAPVLWRVTLWFLNKRVR